MTISRVPAIHSSIVRSEMGDDDEEARKSSICGSIICSIGRCSNDTSSSSAVGMVAAVNWMTIEGRAGVGEVMNETEAASLKPEVGVGTTGRHKMPTINREVKVLMK